MMAMRCWVRRTAFCVGLLVLGCPDVAQAQDGTDSSSTSGFELEPTGYVQFDMRAYPDWGVTPGSGRLRFDSFELRRARPGVAGRWKRLSFEVTVDPFDLDDVVFRDVYVEARLRRRLRIRLGQFKLPGSAEYDRSAANADYLERSSLAQWAAPGRDVGAAIVGGLPGRLSYEAGLYAGDANGRVSRSGLTAAGRVQWAGRRDLDAGSWFSAGRVKANETDAANGLEGRTPAGYRFFDRVYVDGLRVRHGAHLTWTPESWRLHGEWQRTTEQRLEQGLDFEDLPSVLSSGWSASLTRQFGRRRVGARSRWQEYEIGVRGQGLSFDDSGPDTGRDSVRLRATDVRRRAAQSVGASFSWSPTRWSRWLVDGGLERFSEARSAPTAGEPGPYWVLGARFQLELP